MAGARQPGTQPHAGRLRAVVVVRCCGVAGIGGAASSLNLSVGPSKALKSHESLHMRAIRAAPILALLCFGAAVAQQLPAPRIWDVALGTPVAELPADEFVDPACGSNGGPPARVLASFAEFALCPAEPSGLHEVT